MKRVVNLRMMGRWGNQLFQYAFARGYCEKYGYELRCDDWLGTFAFGLSHPPVSSDLPLRTEFDIADGEHNITIRTYAMHQKAVTYSRLQAKEWFKFTPAIQSCLATVKTNDIVAHIRHGDFVGLNDFIAVSELSVADACKQFGVEWNSVCIIDESSPALANGLPTSLAHFLPDFYRLVMAKILFRANSSFSWWAATLGNAEKVFSPKLDGIVKVHNSTQNVPFVEGNHPSISCMHDFCSDVYL